MATRGISGNVRPFPQPGALKTIGEVATYVNSMGLWVKSAVDGLNAKAKGIPYAVVADLPPLDGLTRFIRVPDDPTYGEVICFNGVGTSGTDTGWYRLIPAGTVSGPAASIPAGGTTSQVLGKVDNTDFNMAWQTPRYIPAGGTSSGMALRKTSGVDYAVAWAVVNELTTGGTTGAVLTKNSTADYDASWSLPRYVSTGGTATQVLRKTGTGTADYAWGDAHEVPAGGTTSQVLGKVDNTDYNVAWQTPQYLTTGGTTGQVLTKTSGADYAATWQDPQRPAFVGALVYSTATQTVTATARGTWDTAVYDIGTYFSTANPTRLTVGSGVTYVQVSANVELDVGTGTVGTRFAEIWKNGSAMGTARSAVRVYAAGTNDAITLNLSSPVLAVGSGDYFELNLIQDSGIPATIPPAAASWFALKVIK